ncbi:ester cyclase [Streptomyces sp. NPDC005423]|uniref:ester cyclase n=1 Tax=Streptomyces sp. NPDC005423 TaxID=3155343 RepID=UPI0033B3DCF1
MTTARTTATPRLPVRLLIPAAIAVLACTVTTATADAAPAHPTRQTANTQHRDSGGQLTAKALTGAWLRLWNGDYQQAPRIISPDLRVHAALLGGGDGSSVKGPDGLAAWIAQTRAAFPDLRFALQVRPVINGPYASVRWTCTGTYAGGFPGAEAAPGTVITFTGTDTLRIRDGKVVEYWLNSDMLSLLTQLKVI